MPFRSASVSLFYICDFREGGMSGDDLVEGASFGADELGRYLSMALYGFEEGEGVSEGE